MLLRLSTIAFLLSTNDEKIPNVEIVVRDGIIQGFTPKVGNIQRELIHGISCEHLAFGTLTTNDKGSMKVPKDFLTHFCNDKAYCVYIKAFDDCVQLELNKKYDCTFVF